MRDFKTNLSSFWHLALPSLIVTIITFNPYVSQAGQTTAIAPLQLDLCVTVETEDQTVQNLSCLPVRVTDGSLTNNTSYYSLNVGSGLTGSGTANQLAYWTGASTLTSNADLTIDVSGTPAQNKVLKWNGSAWVPGNITDSNEFTFSIASFTDLQSPTQLIGSGTWKAIGGITYGMTYLNGPPTSGFISIGGTGGVTWSGGNLVLSAPFTGATSASTTAYPASKDTTIVFTVNATLGATNDTETDTETFNNIVYVGLTTTASGFTEADVESLTPTTTSDYTVSTSLNPAAGQYIALAYPTSYTAMDEGDDYEDDGGTDFLFNSMAIAMTRDNANLSITNSAGFTEGYDVYVSNLANLGTASHTFSNTTADQTINEIYYGVTSKTSTYTEADVEGLDDDDGYSPITNDATQIWTTVNLGAGEYVVFAFPKRFGEEVVAYTFKDYETGLAFAFNLPETVSITNANGWTEDFYVYRSENANMGNVTVQTI